MTDDLKQKADKAWFWEYPWIGNDTLGKLRAAVEASIAAALREFYRNEIEPVKTSIGNMQPGSEMFQKAIAAALSPVLERVERLEDRTPLPFDDEDVRLAGPKPAAASCATCGGARFVCDSGKASWGKSWPCMNEDHVVAENRRPCPECSAPPPATQGVPQSSPQAPERVTLCRMWLAHDPSDDVYEGWGDSGDDSFGFAFVRADLLSAAERRIEQLEVQLAGCGVAALGWSKDDPAKPGDYGYSASYGDVLTLREKFTSAERRIAELEKNQDAFAEGAFVNGRAEGMAESAARIAELEKELLVGPHNASVRGFAEGREAGVRAAAEVAYSSDPNRTETIKGAK